MSNYSDIEEPLKLINAKYVSLNTEEVKHNNERLRSTLWDLIEILQNQDPLFDKLFEQPYFGGSFYDDLKVGKPDEFDLDLLLVLPKLCETHKSKNCGCVEVKPSNKPGFFWFKVQQGYCLALDRFIENGYIRTDRILNWLKGCVTKGLNELIRVNPGLSDYTVNPPKYLSESGPALTLQLYGDFGNMSVDLVPAFKFGSEHWPQEGFRANRTGKEHFFLVPKKSKELFHSERYWRPSFQDQERELIKGKERLKPTLRLLKKMRNNLVQTSISSYALKTIVLRDIGSFNWNGTLGDTFVELLEKYKECLNCQRIRYYWNDNNNLLEGIHADTLTNHHNEISRLLKKLKDQHVENPCVVAKVILKEGTDEYHEFMAEWQRRNSAGNRLSGETSNAGSSYDPFDPPTTSRGGTSPGSSPFGSYGSGAGTTSRGGTFPGSSPFGSYGSRAGTTSRGGTFTGSSPFGSNGSGAGIAQQTAEDSSSSGWAIAGGVILGIGALVGLSVLGALNNNNRNQNR